MKDLSSIKYFKRLLHSRLSDPIRRNFFLGDKNKRPNRQEEGLKAPAAVNADAFLQPLLLIEFRRGTSSLVLPEVRLYLGFFFYFGLRKEELLGDLTHR